MCKECNCQCNADAKQQVVEPAKPEFDPKWPHGHQTREGKPVRIFACDVQGNSSRPIVAAIRQSPTNEQVFVFLSGGRFSYDGKEHINDIINKPAPKPKCELWLLTYLVKCGDNTPDSRLVFSKTLAGFERIKAQAKVSPNNFGFKETHIEYEV